MSDSTVYRTTKTKRGFTYRYIYVAPSGDKPYLIFLHGFPSTSNDWRYQTKYFTARGYGLIVPDMLGYAGTDKPDDPVYYTSIGLAGDIIDIVDAEQAQPAIAIGHDWHIDAFLTVLYPADPTLWLTALCPVGGFDAYMESGQVQPRPEWLSQEDYDHIKKELLEGGLRGPTNYYRSLTRSIERQELEKSPIDLNVKVNKPMFFAGALQDYICLPQLCRSAFQGVTDDLTSQDFDTSHWVMLEKPDELNEALEKWFGHVLDVSK
ncbi:alpha/beta-hydrolase [Fistulina hepatica ATCC 64428]|uniref:Alpha/beta-hydrolase n=1 Tax=Fistulina hepatica ATCC 64428 TaxID=1128425 RepID=A0A0D7AK37_9AGAR|nr:alpha/beta-hydrolase [Fistulina hepatica ATCC 64428]